MKKNRFTILFFISIYIFSVISAVDVIGEEFYSTILIGCVFYFCSIFLIFILVVNTNLSVDSFNKYKGVFENNKTILIILFYLCYRVFDVIYNYSSGVINGRVDIYSHVASLGYFNSYLFTFISAFVLYGAIYTFYMSKNKYLFIYFFMLILVSAVTLSRSSFSNFIFIIITFYFVFSIYDVKQSLIVRKRALTIIVCIMMLVSSLMIIQGYTTSNSFSLSLLLKPLENQFLYNGFSFGLSNKYISERNGFEYVLYPFFGFVSEKIILLFENLDVVIDAKYVSNFVDLGGYRANVLYPWWATFYASFNIMGIFLYLIYICSIFILLIKKKWYLLLLLLVWCIFIPYRHPLLTSENVITIITLLFIEIYSKKTKS
ncbi:TPA: O-antigen polymerase [Photobacterium damselae]